MIRKFSIVISFYKQFKYIKSTLDGIFNQSYNNYEVLIRDDFSEDNSADVISSYVNSNNKIDKIKHIEFGEKNVGFVKSINKLLRYCTGDFIIIHGGDDISNLDRLERSLYIFDKYNVDVLGSDAILIDENSNVFHNTSLPKSPFKTYRYGKYIEKDKIILLQNNKLHNIPGIVFGGYGNCYSNKIFEKINYSIPETMAGEDYYLCFIGNLLNGSAFSIEPMLKRRYGNSNISLGDFNKSDISKNIIPNKEKINNIFYKQKLFQININEERLSFLKNNDVNIFIDKDKLMNILKANIKIYEIFANIFDSKSNFFKHIKLFIQFLLIRGSSVKYRIYTFLVFLFPRVYKLWYTRKYIQSLKRRFITGNKS